MEFLSGQVYIMYTVAFQSMSETDAVILLHGSCRVMPWRGILPYLTLAQPGKHGEKSWQKICVGKAHGPYTLYHHCKFMTENETNIQPPWQCNHLGGETNSGSLNAADHQHHQQFYIACILQWEWRERYFTDI